jgi:uncharacterized membrane protein (DUF373 family)
MKSRQKLAQQFGKAMNDENFLRFLGGVESLVSKVLSIAMVIVILVAVYDLGYFLTVELFSIPIGRFSTTLLKIFGLFLNVLIALEILENITAYLKKHVIQVELVIVTSLIAVSRKIIILDLEKTSGIDLIALAVTIFALSISYWIIRRVNQSPTP